MFWDKFINNNPNAEYELEKDEENTEQQEDNNSEPRDKKVKIKWGEFFEFFWRLYDSKQLENFNNGNGKFISPRKTEIEEILIGVEQTMKLTANKVSETIDKRLNELKEKAEDIRLEIGNGQTEVANSMERAIGEIGNLLAEISSRIGSSSRGGSSYY